MDMNEPRGEESEVPSLAARCAYAVRMTGGARASAEYMAVSVGGSLASYAYFPRIKNKKKQLLCVYIL